MIEGRTIVASLILSAVALASTAMFAQADLDQQRYEEEKQHNRLLDQEKWLLRESDSLQRDIYQLKDEVEVRLRKISAAQNKLDSINHDIITVRMKLMP